MGSVLQERLPLQPQLCCVLQQSRLLLLLHREAEEGLRKRQRTSRSINRPNDSCSNKMGRRHQSQRRSVQPQCTFPSQENNNTERKLQQRKKNKPQPPQTKHKTSQHSSQGNLESKSHAPETRMESEVQQEHKPHTGSRGRRHTSAFPCHRPSGPSPDPPQRLSPQPQDDDTDLSDSERLPAPAGSRVPPQLELRPEVFDDDSAASRRQPRGGSAFPDFLPPPFNSWSLSQLALFYNAEGQGGSRPRPVGCLERYMEKLLQLEWRQIQSVQEESGGSEVSCHRSATTASSSSSSAAAASSRLSSPKCILQCQRAFPLTFLSSLATCACSGYRPRPCCRSAHGHARPSRLSPTPEARGATSLPKRSYSESRVHSSDRRCSSPVRTNNHLRRMQASGNIRHPPPPGANAPHPTIGDQSVGGRGGDRTGGLRKRSDSEQRRGGGAERLQRRSGSECRGAGSERRRAAQLKEQEIKPDAVAAIMDNLPASKFPAVHRANRFKQVEFVT